MVYNSHYFYQHYYKLNIPKSSILKRKRSIFLLYERMWDFRISTRNVHELAVLDTSVWRFIYLDENQGKGI